MDKEMIEHLWRIGEHHALPLLELVEAVPGPRAKDAWAELTRREQAWHSCGKRVAELEDSRRVLESDVSLNQRRERRAWKAEARAHAKAEEIAREFELEKKRNRRRETDLARRASDRLDRAEKAEARVEKLEAAQKPRPMSEAPKDGTWVIVRVEDGLAAVSWGQALRRSGRIEGWFHFDATDPIEPVTDEWWAMPGGIGDVTT